MSGLLEKILLKTLTKQGLMCLTLAQGHNIAMSVRLEPANPISRVKHLATNKYCASIKLAIDGRIHKVKMFHFFFLADFANISLDEQNYV